MLNVKVEGFSEDLALGPCHICAHINTIKRGDTNKNQQEHGRALYTENVCKGRHFVKSEKLSVIVEKMPPYAEEDMHYHNASRQFLYMGSDGSPVLAHIVWYSECGIRGERDYL